MWINNAYSRLLIDNHITDINPGFMSKFDSEEYVKQVKKSGVESSMVYATCHNGNCYYPSKIGHIHKNLKEDIFGKVIEGLNREGIIPIAYYTVLHHNDFAKRFPETSMKDNLGNCHSGRYFYSCPNNEKSVSLYKEQIKEILAYDIKGIFIDMTFWPCICLCDACREKYGKPIPQVIDWGDPSWVSFQRFREESMASFAQDLTDFCKEIRPDITVTHQFSPMLHGWFLGQSDEIAEACDYCSGDFYGDKIQQRFGVKGFDALTTHKPFEFMISRCVDLHDHTSSKCDEELILSAMTTLANGGAYFFIDAINPDGTLESSFYDRLKKINKYLTPYRETVKKNAFHITGDVGLYFSMASCVDTNLIGTKLSEYAPGSSSNMSVRKNAVLDETLASAEILIEMHIPYRVVTDNTTDYSDFKTIIIHNSSYLSLDICDRLREFVHRGGTLIVTGATGLYDYEGNLNWGLSDVLGVDWDGNWSPTVNYTGEELILSDCEAPLSRVTTAKILAYFNFPIYPINDDYEYASIHSNPPGNQTLYPAITENIYGKGKCLWIASPFILKKQYTQKEYAKKLYKSYINCNIETDLPINVELTLLSGNNKKAVCVVNMQDQYPPLPVYDRYILIETEKPNRITKVSDGLEVMWEYTQGKVKITIDKLEYGEFFVIE